ncbi:MAG: ABC transporter permease [Clostridia bacterium]|nr:ABC transporter permease [Clostridia bacterium]
MTNSRKKRVLGFLTSQSVILFFFILLIAVVVNTVNAKFLTWNNISSILRQATALGLAACGMTVLIISGQIDISLGSMIGLVTCVMALMLNAGVNETVVSLTALCMCVGCSVLNGGLCILFNAPPFIVTLATNNLYIGTALLITKGYLQTIYGKYRFIASTRFFGWLYLQFIILLAGFLIIHFVLKRTQTGRQIYAIGTNENAAYISGISVKRSKLKFYAISGCMVGFASMVLLSRLAGAQSTTGSGTELEAIGAVVIGGTAINGGKGGVVGTFFGVILLSMISNAINMAQISEYFRDIVYGLVILIALGVTALRARMVDRKGA